MYTIFICFRKNRRVDVSLIINSWRVFIAESHPHICIKLWWGQWQKQNLSRFLNIIFVPVMSRDTCIFEPICFDNNILLQLTYFIIYLISKNLKLLITWNSLVAELKTFFLLVKKWGTVSLNRYRLCSFQMQFASWLCLHIWRRQLSAIYSILFSSEIVQL